jgi:hypothetical protein
MRSDSTRMQAKLPVSSACEPACRSTKRRFHRHCGFRGRQARQETLVDPRRRSIRTPCRGKSKRQDGSPAPPTALSVTAVGCATLPPENWPETAACSQRVECFLPLIMNQFTGQLCPVNRKVSLHGWRRLSCLSRARIAPINIRTASSATRSALSLVSTSSNLSPPDWVLASFATAVDPKLEVVGRLSSSG